MVSELEPTSIEFSLLEEVVICPLTMKMMLEVTRELDEIALKYGGHEQNYASNCLNHLLEIKAIEVLDDCAVAFRKQYIESGPTPVDYIRSCGRMDISLLGAQLYVLGRQVRARNPGERKVTLYEHQSGHVRHWCSGFGGDRIKLPGAVLEKVGERWTITATEGAFVGEPQIREEFVWRDQWWDEPRPGLHVEYHFEEPQSKS